MITTVAEMIHLEIKTTIELTALIMEVAVFEIVIKIIEKDH